MIGRVFLMGALVGAGALMLLPGVAGAVARAARPVARKAGKSGAKAYDEVRRAGAEAYEHFEDLAAEIRADIDVDEAPDTAPTGTEKAANGAAKDTKPGPGADGSA